MFVLMSQTAAYTVAVRTSEYAHPLEVLDGLIARFVSTYQQKERYDYNSGGNIYTNDYMG